MKLTDSKETIAKHDSRSTNQFMGQHVDKVESRTRVRKTKRKQRYINRRRAWRTIVTNGLKWITDSQMGQQVAQGKCSQVYPLCQRRLICCHHLGLVSQLQIQRYNGHLTNRTAVYCKNPIGLQTKSKTCGQSSATVASKKDHRRVYLTQWVVRSLMLFFLIQERLEEGLMYLGSTIILAGVFCFSYDQYLSFCCARYYEQHETTFQIGTAQDSKAQSVSRQS